MDTAGNRAVMVTRSVLFTTLQRAGRRLRPGPLTGCIVFSTLRNLTVLRDLGVLHFYLNKPNIFTSRLFGGIPKQSGPICKACF